MTRITTTLLVCTVLVTQIRGDTDSQYQKSCDDELEGRAGRQLKVAPGQSIFYSLFQQDLSTNEDSPPPPPPRVQIGEYSSQQSIFINVINDQNNEEDIQSVFNLGTPSYGDITIILVESSPPVPPLIPSMISPPLQIQIYPPPSLPPLFQQPSPQLTIPPLQQPRPPTQTFPPPTPSPMPPPSQIQPPSPLTNPSPSPLPSPSPPLFLSPLQLPPSPLLKVPLPPPPQNLQRLPSAASPRLPPPLPPPPPLPTPQLQPPPPLFKSPSPPTLPSPSLSQSSSPSTLASPSPQLFSDAQNLELAPSQEQPALHQELQEAKSSQYNDELTSTPSPFLPMDDPNTPKPESQKLAQTKQQSSEPQQNDKQKGQESPSLVQSKPPKLSEAQMVPMIESSQKDDSKGSTRPQQRRQQQASSRQTEENKNQSPSIKQSQEEEQETQISAEIQPESPKRVPQMPNIAKEPEQEQQTRDNQQQFQSNNLFPRQNEQLQQSKPVSKPPKLAKLNKEKEQLKPPSNEDDSETLSEQELDVQGEPSKNASQTLNTNPQISSNDNGVEILEPQMEKGGTRQLPQSPRRRSPKPLKPPQRAQQTSKPPVLETDKSSSPTPSPQKQKASPKPAKGEASSPFPSQLPPTTRNQAFRNQVQKENDKESLNPPETDIDSESLNSVSEADDDDKTPLIAFVNILGQALYNKAQSSTTPLIVRESSENNQDKQQVQNYLQLTPNVEAEDDSQLLEDLIDYSVSIPDKYQVRQEQSEGGEQLGSDQDVQFIYIQQDSYVHGQLRMDYQDYIQSRDVVQSITDQDQYSKEVMNEIDEDMEEIILNLAPQQENQRDKYPKVRTFTLLKQDSFNEEVETEEDIQGEVSNEETDKRSLWEMLRRFNDTENTLLDKITVFMDLIKLSGLEKEMCKLEGNVTMMAPVNAASTILMEQLFGQQEQSTALLTSFLKLDQIIRNHIILQSIENLKDEQLLPTWLNDQYVQLQWDSISGIMKLISGYEYSKAAFVRYLDGYSELQGCSVQVVTLDSAL